MSETILVLLATFDDPGPSYWNEIWAFNPQAEAESIPTGLGRRAATPTTSMTCLPMPSSSR